MALLTNIKAAQAQRGQSVTITLSSTQALNYLPVLSIGDVCELDSNGKIGYIVSIDTKGNSFKIRPQAPFQNYSNNFSLLDAGQDVII